MDKSTSAAYQQLIHQLSSKPPASCRSEQVDFVNVGLPVYENLFATAIHDAFTAAECAQLLVVAQQFHPWEQAMVNIGNGQQKLYTDVRLCDRMIFDDKVLAAKILDRVLPYLPNNIINLQNCGSITGHGPVKRKETWTISRLNERLRFLRYTPGNYFRSHCDGSFATPGNEEISFVTVHLYLNGDGAQHELEDVADGDVVAGMDKPLVGGATRFLNYNEKDHWDFNPKAGAVLVFQHRNLLHSGEDVLQGTKYTLRSDIMYQKVV